jgi:hypothetical protein
MYKDIEKRNAYLKEYKRKNEFKVCIYPRYNRDEDVITYLQGVPNKTEFIINLVRQAMSRADNHSNTATVRNCDNNG